MKDYSLNNIEKNNFVLNYDVTEDKIIVNFANGERYTIPNTESNIRKLEDKMREQIEESDSAEKVQTRKKTINKLITLGIFLASSLAFYYTIPTPTIFGKTFSIATKFLSFASISVITSTPFIIKAVKQSRIINDIKKHKYYLENESKISNGIQNTNVLANTKNTSNTLLENPTINDIDRVSLQSLEQITTNSDREELFNFDTFSSEEEISKPKTKKKVR